MRSVKCLLGRHTKPVSVFGMNEQRPDKGTRVLAGFRCACGTLVFEKTTSFRAGAGAKRAIKREVRGGR
jgi:hypothetical protein